MGPAPVYRITSDAVAKRVDNIDQTEAYTMQYVSERTTIPVPTIRRVLPSHSDPESHWIIMDYVRGQTLFRCWSGLRWWKKLYIIWTLRRYIRELHRLPLSDPDTPGPIDGHGRPLRCHGLPFPYTGAGPFASFRELAGWFDYQQYCHRVRLHRGWGVLHWSCPPFPQATEPPLVLCHGDLHHRNILLDEAGRVWLVDWGNAGVYPPWWEYVHAAIWKDAARLSSCLPKLIATCLPFIMGNYEIIYQEYWRSLKPKMENVSYDALEEEEGYFERLDPGARVQ